MGGPPNTYFTIGNMSCRARHAGTLDGLSGCVRDSLSWQFLRAPLHLHGLCRNWNLHLRHKSFALSHRKNCYRLTEAANSKICLKLASMWNFLAQGLPKQGGEENQTRKVFNQSLLMLLHGNPQNRNAVSLPPVSHSFFRLSSMSASEC